MRRWTGESCNYKQRPRRKASKHFWGISVIEPIAELALKMYSTKQHAEVKVRTTCRSCESDRLQSVLDLGNLYVSNFADVPDSGRWPRVPLDLPLCGAWGLAQLRHTTPPEWSTPIIGTSLESAR